MDLSELDYASCSSGDTDSECDDDPLRTRKLTRSQLVGVTALACDGPRLLTGNTAGRVFFQDFTTATLLTHENAQQSDAVDADQHATDSSRFWFNRPR